MHFLIVLIWNIPVSAHFLDIVDADVFFFLNQTIALGRGWQLLWAVTNFRGFDIISGVFIFFVLLFYVKCQNKNFIHEFIRYLVFLLILVVINKLIIAGIMELIHYQRSSPSLTLKGALRLSDFVSSIHFKDASHDCFPGDHAAIIMGSVAYFFKVAKLKVGIISIFVLVPFIIPRLAVGAHWFTDCLIGSSIVVTLSYNVWQNTRLAAYLVHFVPEKFRPQVCES